MKAGAAGSALRETEIRPDELMAEQARRYAADVEWLLAKRDGFVMVGCPACGSRAARPAWRKYELDFAECEDCETVYMTPRPSRQLLDEYYRTSENYAYWSEVVFPASEAARREKIFRPRAARAADIARRHGVRLGTLVDVGAGFGTFCEETARLNAFERVVAVEPEPHLAEVCRTKGIEVIEAPVEGVDLDSETVDVVTCFEVIEHLFSPRELLARCRELLSPGGLLIVTCPNVKGFDVLELREAASAVDTEHLNLFHPESLAALLERESFDVLESQTPGRLDAEIVRKRVLADEHTLEGQPFLQRVLIDDWERLGEAFQDFLSASGLSSNMWLVARSRR